MLDNQIKKPSDFSFSPDFRLKKKKDFLRMESATTRLHTSSFLLVLTPSTSCVSRLGIVVTKRIDKRAVIRNKIRRRAREIFRYYRRDLKEPTDILVIARKASITCPFQTMRRQTIAALWQHGFLKDRQTLRGK